MARLVVDADHKCEGRQIIAAEVQSLAVGIVGQSVFQRGFILKVADTGFFHFVNGRDSPKPVIARCIPTVVDVADNAGAVSGIATIEIGRMSRLPVVQVIMVAALLHDMPLLGLIGGVGLGHGELRVEVGGLGAFTHRRIG